MESANQKGTRDKNAQEIFPSETGISETVYLACTLPLLITTFITYQFWICLFGPFVLNK